MHLITVNSHSIIVKYYFNFILSQKMIILILNACIVNAHELNATSNICILKCIKNYSKIHAF